MSLLAWLRGKVACGDVCILAHGADPTGVEACDSALADAIAAVSANAAGVGDAGARILFPPGSYRFDNTVELKKTVILQGSGVGLAGGTATRLLFPPDTTGIIVHRHNTIGTGLESPASTGGDGSIIRGFEIVGTKTGLTGHGIWLRARATIEQCIIRRFSENGIHIVASGGGTPEGNANNYRVDTVRIIQCDGHGFYADGADANAGTVLSLDCVSNAGCGIFDSSFLGSTYVGCHVSANGGASYKTDSANARNVLVGCYSESGHPPSELVSPTLVLGGLHGAGITGNAFVVGATTSAGTLTPWRSRSTADSEGHWLSVGRAANEALTLERDGDGAGGLAIFWDAATGSWCYRHRRLGARTPLRITTDLGTITAGRSAPIPPASAVFAQGLWLGSSVGAARHHTSGAAPPTSGTWARGDVCWNTAPAVGGWAGWICTAGGDPAVWDGFGKIG